MSGYGFGIIGTGAIARLHAAAIADSKGHLVACYDLNPSRSDDFAKEYGIRSYHSIDEFLADEDVGIVTVTTPSGVHFDPAMAAIASKKKAVIVEKPLEITVERCKEMIAAARANGVMLSGIFQSRFHEGARIIKDAIDKGRFGKISLIDAQIKWYRTQDYYDSIPWHGTWAMDGGGALMNQGIHAIDLLRWFGGEAVSVSAICRTLGHERIEVEDTAGAVVSFRSGAVGIIEGTTSAWPGFLKRIEVCGTDGSAILEEESIKFWKFRTETDEDDKIREKFSDCTSSGGGAADPKAIASHGHTAAFNDVIDALDTHREPFITGEEAMKAVELIRAIYASSEKKAPVEL